MRRRPGSPSLLSLVLLSVLATAALPRATWYAHRHAGDGHGHVHGWDGSRLGASSVSVHDFLGHDHDHAHAHAHGADDGTTRGLADHAHEEGRGSARPLGDGHPHGAPNTARGTASARGQTSGPTLAATADDGAHTHWQAPFQTAARASAMQLLPSLVARPLASRATITVPVERELAVRARAPPVAAV